MKYYVLIATDREDTDPDIIGVIPCNGISEEKAFKKGEGLNLNDIGDGLVCSLEDDYGIEYNEKEFNKIEKYLENKKPKGINVDLKEGRIDLLWDITGCDLSKEFKEIIEDCCDLGDMAQTLFSWPDYKISIKTINIA